MHIALRGGPKYPPHTSSDVDILTHKLAGININGGKRTHKKIKYTRHIRHTRYKKHKKHRKHKKKKTRRKRKY